MKKRENEFIEFKKSTSELKQAIISLSAMLNKNNRGIIYFGINNEGNIIGQQIGKETTRDISREIKLYLKPIVAPSIEIIEESGKEIIKVEVHGDNTPYSAYGRYYLRSDDEDNEMTNQQLESFFINKNYDYSKWEKAITDKTIDNIDEEQLINYINKANEERRLNFIYRDSKSTLTKLGLITDNALNNAGYYLFSNEKPLLLKLAVYPTNERLSFIDNKHFRGNILECIDEGIKYILNNIRWKAEIKGATRVETPEIPVEAIREIVVNSFAHMKVNNSSFNEIYITPTKVHIYNPGQIVKGKDPIDFASGATGSIIRNPLVATTLYLNKTIEAFGTGFGRVFNLCEKNNIQYKYFNNEFGFVFEFIRNKKEVIDVPIELTNLEGKLIDLIKTKNKVAKKELANLTNVSEMTVQRTIKSLIEKRIIERIGSNKTGYWRVIDNNSL